MKRRAITRALRVRVFDAGDGKCHICGLPIQVPRDPWDVEHVKPLWLGGTDDESNMAPAHKHCHGDKSADEAAPRAKGTRIRARHLGIRKARSSFPGSKTSPWKKTFSRGWVRRARRAVSRRAALITQADVARAIRVAKQTGADRVEVGPDIVWRRDPIKAETALKTGHVYFIAGGDLIKIGFSYAPLRRFAKMQIECPVSLTLLHSEPGSFARERELHQQFAMLRVRGEWFRAAAELLAFIERRKVEL